MIIEELFRKGIMKMGPSRGDPHRLVGTFEPEFVSKLPALRTAELETMRWIAGDWSSVNSVPASSAHPAYQDQGKGSFRFCENDGWICLVRGGKEKPHITFDPFSRQWMYVLTEGAYGILRSPGWRGNQLIFTGHMTMIGVDCEWRLTLTKSSGDEFHYRNEEQLPDGRWVYMDEWKFTRAPVDHPG